MRNEPVVVAVVFQPKCFRCQVLLSGDSLARDFLAHQFCSSCGLVQPLAAEENYFSVLGETCRFGLDPEVLEKRFYRASRLFHPDRFSNSDSAAQALSLSRMSFLNQAYQTLKNPEALREYVFKREGIFQESLAQKTGQIPIELIEIAEGWFELQDEILEEADSLKVQKKLREFLETLQERKARIDEKILSLEKKYDERKYDEKNDDSKFSLLVLEEMAREVQNKNYLSSIEKNRDRMTQNVTSI